MNLRALFEYRSGRVIAVFRAVLAVVFLLALAMEPAARSGNIPLGEQLLTGYVGVSFFLIWLAWRSWWYDHQLALPVLVLDVGVFIVAVYLTESLDSDFGSPFLALFTLVVLSATLRWNWRAAARVGVIVILLFVTAGFAIMLMHLPLDQLRMARRTFYMSALLLVLVWFGLQRREPQVPMLTIAAENMPAGDELWVALEYAMAQLGAPVGLIAWADSEEPWIDWRLIDAVGRGAHRSGPEVALELGVPGNARLFDLERRRKLVRQPKGFVQLTTLTNPVPFTAEAGIREGLALPFRAVTGQGLLVLGGIVGLGPDYLELGDAVAREIGIAFNRTIVERYEREALVTRTRNALARDLHDSVAQSLAGACFRLEALRRDIHDGERADFEGAAAEIATVRDALRQEQGHVRMLIDGLRNPAPALQQCDLEADLANVLADAGAHWGVTARLAATTRCEVPRWLSYEIQQLVREAVANAARHGLAREVLVNLGRENGNITLGVSDDGGGFVVARRASRPWSISERVAALGGQLTVDSGTDGTHLAIVLPGRPEVGVNA